jgi:anthranilate synthase/aminodeoxychorismate synthase-like glutamine amidotransferase
MVLVIDNYDSFTYNLVQYLGELKAKPVVYRNDEIKINQIEKMAPSHIIISPGPGRPDKAGVSEEVIKVFAGKVPILGVCLGHQAIGEVFGGKITYAPYLMHGKTSLIKHNNQGIFEGLDNPLTATRYHSLVIERASLPNEFKITAETEDGIIMGIQHNKYALFGVQFHPESILTAQGHALLKNFLQNKSG